MHDGTVRDLCFIEDMSNKSSLLVSGGAGDCKIYVTDCATGTPFQALTGHSGQLKTRLSLLFHRFTRAKHNGWINLNVFFRPCAGPLHVGWCDVRQWIPRQDDPFLGSPE